MRPDLAILTIEANAIHYATQVSQGLLMERVVPVALRMLADGYGDTQEVREQVYERGLAVFDAKRSEAVKPKA
jgi:hypothetical protein